MPAQENEKHTLLESKKAQPYAARGNEEKAEECYRLENGAIKAEARIVHMGVSENRGP